MFGAEQLLMSHCRDEQTFDKLVTMVNDFKQYFIARITSPFTRTRRRVTKLAGSRRWKINRWAARKAGSSEVVDVLRYGERLKVHALPQSAERARQRCGGNQRAGQCGVSYGAV